MNREKLLIISKSFLSFFIILLVLLIPLTSIQAAPRDELEKTEQEIDASRARQQKLTQEQEKIASELEELQTKLIDAAAVTQAAEAELFSVQEKLSVLNEQVQIKETELAEKNKKLTSMIQASLHLSRVPPEAMVMVPGNENSMKAARALKLVSDSIREEVKDIRVQAKELQRLRDKITARHNELQTKKDTLAKEKQILQRHLTERTKIQQKLGDEQELEKKKVKDLVRKAQNLQMLVMNTDRPALYSDSKEEWGSRASKRSFAAYKGKITAPVIGKQILKYGASRHGETTRGIVVAAAADGAQVVAPFDGQVVFAGTFLNYGKLVILKHSDDFHTLLAGLGTIEVRIGDFLLEGEPIGAMGNAEAGRRLYLELRKNNQPIDPVPWIRQNKKS